ncbi:MAG: hydantoinase/oxoprolinase family protein [Alphaproteobacteria bacterium]|nr:hydantoinase/oxoprolinase family protein [Alphaproteobacteria bacterium]
MAEHNAPGFGNLGLVIRIGVDIGGTFTDVVVLGEDDGRLWTAKAMTTPTDPSIGVLDGLALVAERIDRPLRTLLGACSLFIHGTTVATNLLVERKGARLGLLTTEGFRDVMELREGTKPRRYDLRMPFPAPLIARRHRLEVPERVRYDGRIERPLDEAAAAARIASLREAGVEALVICLLHAHRHPAHEDRLAALATANGWRAYVSLSHRVLPREGEYDRLSTAAVNAYVGPGLARYLERLQERLDAAGGQFKVLVMQSTGGVLPLAEATAFAVGSVLSGPAGGAMAGALFARLTAAPLLVTCDMGGTSTDISVIEHGAPVERHEHEMSDVKICAPAIDIAALGAGGGSIARLDSGGLLEVGPESAGAAPGPACYGRGGTLPTVTDANLVLGYLAPGSFLGGRLRLDRAAAEHAVRTAIAAPLAIGLEDAAYAIHTLTNSRIAEGIRAATVRRGYDPRDAVLLGFGGAAGLHMVAVARDLSIPRVVVPNHASVLSALGFLASDVRHDSLAAIGQPFAALAPAALRKTIDALETEGRARLRADGFADADIVAQRLFDCRYLRQAYTVEVPIAPDRLAEDGLDWLTRDFAAAYERLYFHSHPGETAVVETVRVVTSGKLPPLDLPTHPRGAADPTPAATGTRRVWLEGWHEIPVFAFDALVHGMAFAGPALVESESTTVLVPDGARAATDAHGSLVIGTR